MSNETMVFISLFGERLNLRFDWDEQRYPVERVFWRDGLVHFFVICRLNSTENDSLKGQGKLCLLEIVLLRAASYLSKVGGL